MGWIKVTDLNSGKETYPKDAILLPPGMKPPLNYRFCYLTKVPVATYASGGETIINGTPSVLRPDVALEAIEVEREVWAPLTGEEDATTE